MVVRAPESSTPPRKLGATGASGDAASVGRRLVPSARGRADGRSGSRDGRARVGRGTDGRDRAPRDLGGGRAAPATERLHATTLPMQPAGVLPGRFSWPAIAGTAAIVFVLALMFITAIELISGKPLASIFGNAGTGTSLHNSPPPAPTTTTSSTTTSTSSTTTSTSSTTTTKRRPRRARRRARRRRRAARPPRPHRGPRRPPRPAWATTTTVARTPGLPALEWSAAVVPRSWRCPPWSRACWWPAPVPQPRRTSEVARSTSRARLVSHLAIQIAFVGPLARRPAISSSVARSSSRGPVG